jgi:peptidoglycan/xylan/chitin deacetylase (PgdA/CDA1 family)
MQRRKVLIGMGAAALAASAGPVAAGTARTLSVAVSGGPGYGRKHFAGTLPLADGEVVLTFDDGPAAGTTPRVLDALAARQIRATFFLIGRNAAGLPHLAARIAREGHSIGNHTYSHPWTIDRLSYEQGLADIDRGAASITAALGGAGRLSPFLRFPGFVETAALRAELSRRNIAVFGADVWASDWNPMTPETQLDLVMRRILQARKGIVLFHDTREQTAAMLPAFLAALDAKGFRVVQAVA